MNTITYTGTLVVEECCNCHMMFAMPNDLQTRARQEGKNLTFYCPAGHPQGYSDGEVQRLKKQLEAETLARQRAETQAAAQKQRRESAERSASAARGQVTKLKNRVKNGVCPCCNRHFENLERHIKGQHPEYASVGR